MVVHPDYAPFKGLDVPPLCTIGFLGLLVWYGLKVEPPAATGRVLAWTGLRWIVAMTIFCEHSGYLNVACAGWFLMMSGAMLALGRGGGGTCKGWAFFLIRRLARIFPAYWICLVLRTGLDNLPAWHTFLGLDDTIYNSHTLWFISTVIHLYMMYPFLSMFVDAVGTQKSIARALGVAAFAYFVQLVYVYYVWSTPDDPLAAELFDNYRRSVFGHVLNSYKNPLTRCPLFLMGICCAHASQQIGGPWIRRLGILTDVSSGLIFLMIAFVEWKKADCEIEGSPILNGMFCPDSLFLRMTLFSPLLFVNMLGLGVGSQSLTQWCMTQPVILLLGKWSYGVYLYGMNWFAIPPPLAILAGSYAKTCMLGALSFNLIEEPGQRFANWITTPAPVVEQEESLTGSTDSDEESMQMTTKLAE